MKTINFSVLEKSELRKLAEFVVQENFLHHNENFFHDPSFIRKEIEYILNEEKSFSNSRIIVAQNNNQIIGSIRTLKWNMKDILPVEKMFSVKLSSFLDGEQYNIWHIGRFAIKKGYKEGGINLFKTLMTFAIQDVCSEENALAVAECDAKLLKILKILGINAHHITNSIHYLGSETIPIILEHESLKNFLKKNIYLVKNYDLDILHRSVVFKDSIKNYTFV